MLLTDNGSTFLAAAMELTHLLSSDELSERLAHKGVERKFIPKRAPWCREFWEPLVGLTKSALKKTLGCTYATLESLQTIIVEIEALLNDRPLTHVITPANLLCGKRITTLSHCTMELDELDEPDFGDVSDLRRQARAQALIVKHFWTRWKREYLTALRETYNNEQRVKIGDIILVHGDTPRIKWKFGVIEGVNKGADGLIRSAVIQTTTGKTNQPIAHLYPLEVTASETA